MFPCCGYDPGIFAYLSETGTHVSDEKLDRILAVVAIASLALCYSLLFALS